MAAYSASAIIRDARPRRRGSGASVYPTVVATWSTEETEMVTADIDDRSFDVAVAEWWAEMTASFSQTTFYLFDPESWR